MALDSYTNLQTAIANLLNRTDLTSYIPDWIALTEAEMNAALRVRRMEAKTTLTVAAEYVNCPSDFLGVVTMEIEGTPITQMKSAGAERVTEMKHSPFTAGGLPRFYATIGTQFQFVPTPDSSYTADLTYYQAIPALASNSSNWVLANFPAAYLYGAAKHSAPFLIDDDRIVMWTALAADALDRIQRDDAMSRYGGRLNRRAKSFG